MIRKKKTPRRKLIEALDKTFAEIIKLRANYTCEKSGKCGGVMHCSHIIPRTHLGLRWDLENAICLSMREHLYWWHKNPLEANTWFLEKYGNDRWQYLIEKSKTTTKYSTSHLQFLLIALNQTLEQLKKVEG